jgi:hypothetical protein
MAWKGDIDDVSFQFTVFSLPDCIGFVVPSLSLEIASLFREAKGQKSAKTAKRFFFCSFC